MADWKATGTVFIACNCDWGCPCNFNAPPTTGFCQGGWVWSLEEGRFNDVDVSGLSVALFAKWPGAIHEGNGEAVAYFDERANASQRAVLTRLLRGEVGGPWGIFQKTYNLSDPVPAACKVDSAELHSKIKIGDAVTIEMEPMRNPVTDAEIHPGVLLPEGLVVKEASLARSRVFAVNDRFSFQHPGKYTAFGRFDYAGSEA